QDLLQLGDPRLVGRARRVAVEDQVRPLQEGRLPQRHQVRSQAVLAAGLRLGLHACQDVEHQPRLELPRNLTSLPHSDAPSDRPYPPIMHLSSFRGALHPSDLHFFTTYSDVESPKSGTFRLYVRGVHNKSTRFLLPIAWSQAGVSYKGLGTTSCFFNFFTSS